jgi:hypothetical protein
MIFVPVDKTGEYHMIFSQDGQVVQNVFHVHFDEAPNAESLADAAGVLKDWWDTELRPSCATNLSLQRIEGVDLSTQDGTAVVYAGGLPLTGGATGATPFPNHVTFAVKWGTAFRGRSYRGRTYHLGLTENSVTGNTIGGASLTTFLAAYGALIEALSTAGYELVVASKFHNKGPRTLGVATPVLSCSIDPTVDSQRRRLPGRGQ